jgi:hypothetical protein
MCSARRVAVTQPANGQRVSPSMLDMHTYLKLDVVGNVLVL